MSKDGLSKLTNHLVPGEFTIPGTYLYCLIFSLRIWTYVTIVNHCMIIENSVIIVKHCDFRQQ